jgi:hypothetical protein
MNCDQDERFTASKLVIYSDNRLVNTANPVMVIDTPPVQQGSLWIVERANVTLEFDFTGAGPPAAGDIIGLYICPPNQQPDSDNPTVTGIAAIKPAIASRPIIIEEADLHNANTKSDQLTLTTFGGAATSWYVSLRTLRKFYVPSQWTVRAIANLQGDNGGIAGTTIMYMNLMYAQLDNC